jgi:hypothetical protein
MTTTFFALRYQATVPVKDRHHGDAVGRYDTYEAAETALQDRRNKNLLEVVERTVPSPPTVKATT